MKNGAVTTKQKKAIHILLSGGSHTDAAAAAGVSRNAITQWLKDPDFVQALHEGEKQIMDEITRTLTTAAAKSVGVLTGIQNDVQSRASSRLRAADIILGRLMQIKELSEFDERIRKLEELAARGQNE